MQRRLVAAEDRVQDARGRVDFVQRRLERVPPGVLHLRGNAAVTPTPRPRRVQVQGRRGVRAARPVGFSSLIQPVSTAVMNTCAFARSAAHVRVIMLSAALAMFLCDDQQSPSTRAQKCR